MDADEDATTDVLRFGSAITLYFDASGRNGVDSSAPSGFVWGEGFSDTSIGLAPGESTDEGWKIPSCYGECVFVVFPKLQYSAASTLAAHLRSRDTDLSSPSSEALLGEGTQRRSSKSLVEPGPPAALAPPGTETAGDDAEEDLQTDRLIARARESAAMEAQANKEFVHAAFGRDVRYGMTVQLLHQRSRSFVTVKPKAVSASEADSNAMALEAKGSFGSHFTVLPRYKHRQEGDKVHMDDQVVLFSKDFRLALHVSSIPLPAAKMTHEVNASMSRTSWRIRLYAGPETTASSAIRGGDVIRLFHWEAEGFLMRSSLSALTGSTERILEAAHSSDSDTPSSKPTLQSLVDRAADAYKPELSDKQATHAETFGSNALWEIELPDPSQGGEVRWGMAVRFRHVGTRRYLALTGSEVLLEKAREVLAHACTRQEEAEESLLDRLHHLPDIELAKILDIPIKHVGHPPTHARKMKGKRGSTQEDAQLGDPHDAHVPYHDHRDRDTLMSQILASPDNEEKEDAEAASRVRSDLLASATSLESAKSASEKVEGDDTSPKTLPTMTAVADASSLFIVFPTGNDVQGLVSSHAGVRLQHVLTGTWLHADERNVRKGNALQHFHEGAQRLANVLAVSRPVEKPEKGAYTSRRRTTVGLSGVEVPRDRPDLSSTKVDLTELTSRLATFPVPVRASLEGVEECAFELSRASATLVSKTMFVLSALPPLNDYVAAIDSLARGLATEPPPVAGNGEQWASGVEHSRARGSTPSDSSESSESSDGESSDGGSEFEFGGNRSKENSRNEQLRFTAAFRALSELVFFCIDTDGSDALVASGLPIKPHQDLLIEQGVVELLVQLIKSPFTNWGGPFTLEEVAEVAQVWLESEVDMDEETDDLEYESESSLDSEAESVPGWQDGSASEVNATGPRGLGQTGKRVTALRHVHFLTRLAYRLLTALSSGNPTAELHVAKHLDTFTAQLGYGLTAETVMTALVSDNRDLLEMIPPGIVLRFLNLIREKGKQSIFLDFLTGLCSCRGRGVPSKQDLVCDFIFGNADGVFEASDHDELGATQAKDSDVILPMRPAPVSETAEASLQVFVPFDSEDGCRSKPSVASSAKDSEPSGEWIDVVDLYRHGHPFAEYLTSTIKLFTEMCVDRNYVCITEIEAMIPLNALMACVASTVLGDSIRAAYCRLLYTLHLDKGQQDRITIPNLTRLWNDLEHAPEISQPPVVPPLEFRSVKRWVVHLLASQGGILYSSLRARNELLLAALELASGMLRFGFFSSTEELALLAQPVIRLLDGRTDRTVPPPNVLESPEFRTAIREVSGTWQTRFDSRVSRSGNVGGTRLSNRTFSSKQKVHASKRTLRKGKSSRRGLLGKAQAAVSSSVGASARGDQRHVSALTGSFLAMNPSLDGFNPKRSDFADRTSSATMFPVANRNASAVDSVIVSSKARIEAPKSSTFLKTAQKADPHTQIASKPSVRADTEAGRYRRSADFLLVARCKLVMCGIMSFVAKLRTSAVLANSLRAFRRHYIATNPDEGKPPGIGARRMRAVVDGQGHSSEVTHVGMSAHAVARAKMLGRGATHRRNKVGPIVEPAKEESLRTAASSRPDSGGVLSAIRGVGADFGKLVGVSHDEEEEPPSMSDLVEDVLGMVESTPLEWTNLARYDVVMVLMDLMSYEDTELRAAATSLMYGHFNQHCDLLDCMQRVQLLVSPATVKVYGEARSLFTLLRKDVEQSEMWLGMTKPGDLTVSRRVNMTIAFLGSLLWTKPPSHGALSASPTSLAGATGSPDAERQRLLYNMGVHTVVLALLDDIVQVMASRKSAQRSLPRILAKELNRLVATAFAFIAAFVACGEDDVQLGAELGITPANLRYRADEAAFASQLAGRFDLSTQTGATAFMKAPATAMLAASRSVSPRANSSGTAKRHRAIVSGTPRASSGPAAAVQLREALLKGGKGSSAATSTRQTNQEHIAHQLPLLLKLHKFGKNASSILRDVVRDNLPICQAVPDQVFTDLLTSAARSHDPLAMEALAAIAWSEDVPVARSQEIMLRQLVERSSSVMLMYSSGFDASDAAIAGVKDPQSAEYITFTATPYVSKFGKKTDAGKRRKSGLRPPPNGSGHGKPGPLARATGPRTGGIGDVNPENSYASRLRAMRDMVTIREVARALMHHGVGHFHRLIYNTDASHGTMSDELREILQSQHRGHSSHHVLEKQPTVGAASDDAASETANSDAQSVVSGTDMSHTGRGTKVSSLAQSSGSFPMLYHIRQLHLLSRLSVGRDRSRETHVQHLAPLSPLLVTLADPQTILPVRSATADLLLHTWIDAEKPASKLRGNRLMLAWVKREALFLEQWAAAIRNQAHKATSGSGVPKTMGPGMDLLPEDARNTDGKRAPNSGPRRSSVQERLAGTAPIPRGQGKKPRGLPPLSPFSAAAGSKRERSTKPASALEFEERAVKWLWKWQFEVEHVFATLLPTLTLYYALFCARGLMSPAEREAATSLATGLLRVLDAAPVSGFKSSTASWMRVLQSHHLYVVAILLDWLSDFVELPEHLQARLERHMAAFVRTERVRFAAAQVPILMSIDAGAADKVKMEDARVNSHAAHETESAGVFDRLVSEASPSTRAVILRAKELVQARPSSRGSPLRRHPSGGEYTSSSAPLKLDPDAMAEVDDSDEADTGVFLCLAHDSASSLPDPMNHIARRWWRATGNSEDEAVYEDDPWAAVVSSGVGPGANASALKEDGYAGQDEEKQNADHLVSAKKTMVPLSSPLDDEGDASTRDPRDDQYDDKEAELVLTQETAMQLEAAKATKVVDAFHMFLESIAAHPNMLQSRKNDFLGLCRAHLLVDAETKQLVDGFIPPMLVPLSFDGTIARLVDHLNSLPTLIKASASTAAVAAAAGGITKAGQDTDEGGGSEQGMVASKSGFSLARRAGEARVREIESGGGTSAGLRGFSPSELLRSSMSKETLVTTVKMLQSLTVSLPLPRDVAQRKMTDIGVAAFFLDKLGEVGGDADCFRELIEGLIGLLDGGNEHVQRSIRRHLAGNGYDAFFEQLFNSLEEVMEQVDAEAHGGVYQSKRTGMRILRLMQLLCEGHNLQLQNFLRKQGDTLGSVNLVAQTAKFFHTMHDKIASRESAELAEQVLDTLVEFVQGPCLENQMTVVQNKFVEAAGFVMAIDRWPGVNEDLQMNLHYKTVLALVSLFEGRHDLHVHTRVASLLPLDVMQQTMMRSYTRFLVHNGGQYNEEAFLQRYLTKQKADFSLSKFLQDERQCAGIDIGFAVYILLRHLVDADVVPRQVVEPHDAERRGPTRITSGGGGELSLENLTKLTDKAVGEVAVTYKESYTFFATHCGRIEIQRNGALEYFLFPVPPVCAFLTRETINRTEWELDRESPNSKIGDLFGRMEGFIVEMMHQQWVHAFISSIPILSAIILSVRLWKRLSWFMALFINFLLLACYETDDFNVVKCSDKFYGYRLGIPVNRVIFICGIIQTVTSSLIVVHFLLNHAPLIVKAGRRDALQKDRGEIGHGPSAMPGIVGGERLLEGDDGSRRGHFHTPSAAFVAPASAGVQAQSTQSLYANLEEEMMELDDEGEDDDDISANKNVITLNYDEEIDRFLSTCPFGVEGIREADTRYSRITARQGLMLLKSRLRTSTQAHQRSPVQDSDGESAVSRTGSPWRSRDVGTRDDELVRLGRRVLSLGTSHAGASALLRGLSAASLAHETKLEEEDEIAEHEVTSGRNRGEPRCCSRFTSWCASAWADTMYLLRSGTFVYWISYIVFTLAGNLVHPFAFAYHLTDIVNRYEELRIVLRAVTKPIKQLSLTFLLMIVTEWIFTVVAFYTIRSDFLPFNDGDTENECNTLLQCFATMFDQGFKNDGGIGGYLVQLSQDSSPTQHYLGRLVFDQLFNILLVTVLLNVTFGIIVDTFGALREQTKNKEEDMATVCFVCSIDRSTFDRHTKRGFEHHVEHDHDKWNYVYAAAHLQFKPRTERTGVEEYLWHSIHRRDATFFPLHRAAVLMDALTPEEEADQLRNKVDELTTTVASLKRAMRTQLAGIRKAISSANARPDETHHAPDAASTTRR